MAEIFNKLMTQNLEYKNYITQGGIGVQPLQIGLVMITLIFVKQST
jgi:hypothetical protein